MTCRIVTKYKSLIVYFLILCFSPLEVWADYSEWDDEDYWEFADGDDDSWTYLDEISCTGTAPADDDGFADSFDDSDDVDWGDLYDDTYDYFDEPDNNDFGEKDCNGVVGGDAFFDHCGQCVGGKTGRTPCTQDCAGVWGGRAYTKDCKGGTVCINTNTGTFDNQLEGEDLLKFNLALKNMVTYNCLQESLVENLDEYYGINISISEDNKNPGSFNPCDYTISFSSSDAINSYTLTAELFHAYQEQIYGGKLSAIMSDPTHKGGSNVEAEEKALGFLCAHFTGGSIDDENYFLLVEWCNDFCLSHIESDDHNVTLTPVEIQCWFEALEEFQQYNAGLGTMGDMYGSPIDYTLLPNAIINLWNSATDCDRFIFSTITIPRSRIKL